MASRDAAVVPRHCVKSEQRHADENHDCEPEGTLPFLHLIRLPAHLCEAAGCNFDWADLRAILEAR